MEIYEEKLRGKFGNVDENLRMLEVWKIEGESRGNLRMLYLVAVNGDA